MSARLAVETRKSGLVYNVTYNVTTIHNNKMSNDTMTDDDSSIQGILFKRRDVFRQIWRPRWFILSPQDAVMTYHLLSRDVGSHHHATPQEPQDMQSGVDYDVAPRGTIYLADCSIEANERLTRPQDNLYVFTITPPLYSDTGPCFLATTSPESRDEWIQKLASACGATTADDATSIATTDHGLDNIASDERQQQVQVAWNTTPSRTVLNGVPRRLAQRIDSAIASYLPLLNETRGWKLFLQDDNGVTAYERRYNHCFMLKTVASIPFPPKQVFSLLVDCKRRRDFETNVRHDERLEEFGSHTFLDYYAYQAVWPTLARDFGVVLHWRVISRGGGGENGNGDEERAILMVAFSDDAADELKPPASDHVRADLKISLYLVQPTTSNGDTHSLVIRILSFDLCGNVPKSLTSKVIQQQATMPLVISQHLQETEPNTPEWLAGGELSNASVERDVIAKLSETEESANKRRPKYVERGESLLLREDSSAANNDDESLEELPLSVTALLLLTPLVLWSFANSLDLPGKETYFILASILAVRAVVLSNLGLCYEDGMKIQRNVDKVTCRFSVDLKGVLRFIANRKEEQEEEQIESTEVSVIHIVIAAIAVAMAETPPLKCKRVFLPFIGIDGYYFSRKGGFDISLLVPSAEDGKQDDIYNLKGIGSMSVQSIADLIVHEQEIMNDDRTRKDVFARISRLLEHLASLIGFGSGQSLGTCLVVASPDHSEHGEVDIDAAPLEGSGVNVSVVVGGVRLLRDAAPVAAIPAGRPNIKPPPKPTLSMSITIDCPICSVASSRRFAERVQQLVQFPEMCDDAK